MFSCNFCNKEFNSKRALSAHLGYKHKTEMKEIRDNELVFKNITRKALEQMRTSVDVCMICGKHETANTRPDVKITANNLCADHDHNTGLFRGFLCVQCNRNMGWFDKYKQEIEKYTTNNMVKK